MKKELISDALNTLFPISQRSVRPVSRVTSLFQAVGEKSYYSETHLRMRNKNRPPDIL